MLWVADFWPCCDQSPSFLLEVEVSSTKAWNGLAFRSSLSHQSQYKSRHLALCYFLAHLILWVLMHGFMRYVCVYPFSSRLPHARLAFRAGLFLAILASSSLIPFI